jgi:hypothetical protein
MAVTLTDRTNAGNTYTSTLSAFITAFVELAATERALLRQGIDPPGGHFGGEVGDIQEHLRDLRHPVYAISPHIPRLSDRVTARAAQL